MSKSSRPAEKISPLEIPIEGATPSATLAKLYRQALSSYDIKINKFNHLLEQFLTAHRQMGSALRDRSSDRGNLRKELLKDNMTFKSLCKGLNLITVRKVEIILNMVDAGNEKRSIRQVINFGELPTEAYEDGPTETCHLIQPRKEKHMPDKTEGLLLPVPTLKEKMANIAAQRKPADQQPTQVPLVIKPTLKPKRVGLRT